MIAGKKIIMVAGPNEAGKTTFALEFLPNEAGCPEFVNADLIAAGLSPFAPELAAVKAARLMLEQIYQHVAKGINFAFETTLSGRSYAQLNCFFLVCRRKKWRSNEYINVLRLVGIMSLNT